MDDMLTTQVAADGAGDVTGAADAAGVTAVHAACAWGPHGQCETHARTRGRDGDRDVGLRRSRYPWAQLTASD